MVCGAAGCINKAWTVLVMMSFTFNLVCKLSCAGDDFVVFLQTQLFLSLHPPVTFELASGTFSPSQVHGCTCTCVHTCTIDVNNM